MVDCVEKYFVCPALDGCLFQIIVSLVHSVESREEKVKTNVFISYKSSKIIMRYHVQWNRAFTTVLVNHRDTYMDI